jgi:hypothetical protein
MGVVQVTKELLRSALMNANDLPESQYLQPYRAALAEIDQTLSRSFRTDKR